MIATSHQVSSQSTAWVTAAWQILINKVVLQWHFEIKYFCATMNRNQRPSRRSWFPVGKAVKMWSKKKKPADFIVVTKLCDAVSVCLVSESASAGSSTVKL